MKNTCLLLLTLVLSLIAVGTMAQDGLSYENDSKLNIVDVTAGGPGMVLTFNYNRIISSQPDYFVNTSIGIGTMPFIGGTIIPHSVTVNLGKRTSFLELGLAGSYWSGRTNASGFTEVSRSYNVLPIAGWRKHFFRNRAVFRVYFSPVINVAGEYIYEDYEIFPYAGLSLGYSF